MMAEPYPKEFIQKIRREVINGKSKYWVAKEMNLDYSLVFRHTSDLPSMERGPYIANTTLELLKQLLEEGYVNSGAKNNYHLRKLKKLLPMIQRAQKDAKSIYFLEDKNKLALGAMIKESKSRVISYRDLASMSQVFDVKLSSKEKRSFLLKKSYK